MQRRMKRMVVAALLAAVSLVGGVASAESLAETATGNTAFAFDLYRQLKSSEGENNLFMSPYSVSTALAMTYAGSAGETQRQMAEALHYALPQPVLHEGFAELQRALCAKPDANYQLLVANALWGQKEYSFKPEFLALTDRYYQGAFQRVDFSGDSEQSRRSINQWVAEKTSGKIEELLKPGDVNSMTRLVLTNAIYFKGDWQEKFKKENTIDAAFHKSDGETLNVPMMQRSGTYRYAETESAQWLELPYAGGDLAMVVWLPKGQAKADGGDLTPDGLQHALRNMISRPVDVALPKFKFQTRYYLENEQLLPQLGMTDAFDPLRADFSGIDGSRRLSISHVVHQAVIEVNEEGSEAAASTGVVVGVRSILPQQPVRFTADKPFTFLIVHKATNSVLFMGRVADPSAR